MMEKYILETKEIQSWAEIEVSETFSEATEQKIEVKSVKVDIADL